MNQVGIFTISGFTETEERLTGMEEIQRQLDDQYRHEDRVHVYDLRPWKHNAKGLAALAKRDGITHAIILGYSWGGGYGSPRLAKCLIKEGIKIPLVLLCDPVYRPQWLPSLGPANIFGFRALIPRSAVITFPAEIKCISGIRQHNNIPQGHKVRIGDGPAFDMVLINRSNINHGLIDNSYEWKSLVAAEIPPVVQDCLK